MTKKSGGIRDLLSASGPSGLQAVKAQGFADVWGDTFSFKVDGHNYNFDGRWFLRDIVRDPHPEVVVRKGAQLGVTVTALMIALHRLCSWHWNVMYLLPVKAGTVSFTQGRIDPIIAASPALKRHFVAVDNANHKRTKTSNLYIRGTNVVTELREVPVDFEIWDERDKMREENLPLARTRMDGSKHKHLFQLSTPTVPDYGIDLEYKLSDQRQWFIKCPHCSNQLCLDWDTHVKIDEEWPKQSTLECDHCHKAISHDEMLNASVNGQWIVMNGDRHTDAHGYHISQLYSPTRQLYELVRIWLRGQEKQDEIRELMNSALGLGYVADGDKLTETQLDACRVDGYQMPDIHSLTGYQINFGIDVGSVLHVQASVVEQDGRRRKVFVRSMRWGQVWDLFAILESRGVKFTCVIDHQPETKQATDLAERFWGLVFLAHYNDFGKLATWTYPKHRGEVGRVDIDRTVGLDSSHHTYMRQQVMLPANARDLGENRRDDPYNGWYKQMMSQVRIVVPNNKNEPVAKYVQTGGADHWDHSDLYEFIASTLVAPPPDELPKTGDVVQPEELGMPDFMSDILPFEYEEFGGGWADGIGLE